MKNSLFTFFVLCGGFLQADEISSSDFHMDWKLGKQYEERLVMKQKISIPFRSADATTEMVMTLTPRGKGKSAQSLGLSIDGFKTLVDMPLPKRNEQFDSTKPEQGNQDIAAFYNTLHGLSLKATVDKRGHVTEMQGLDKLDLDNAILNRFLGKEQLAALLRQGWFLSLPERPIQPGGSWPYKITFPTPIGTLKLQGTYTVQGGEMREGVLCWKVALLGTMETPPLPVAPATPAAPSQPAEAAADKADDKKEPLDAEAIEAKLAKLGLSVKQATMQGAIFYNPQTKLIHDSVVTTDIKIGVANFSGEGKPAEIPIHQEVKVTLVEKK